MPKRRVKKNVCPSCGTVVETPYKTWEIISPFPDKKMRITLTTMGMFKCPACGKRFRGVVAKVKLGAEEVEIES